MLLCVRMVLADTQVPNPSIEPPDHGKPWSAAHVER